MTNRETHYTILSATLQAHDASLVDVSLSERLNEGDAKGERKEEIDIHETEMKVHKC